MFVRFVRDYRQYQGGQVVDVSLQQANAWIAEGAVVYAGQADPGQATYNPSYGFLFDANGDYVTSLRAKPGVGNTGPGAGSAFGLKGAGAVWYVDPRIAPGDESDSFDGGAGVGKLRDSWADVTWAANGVYLQACGSSYTGVVTVGASGTSGQPITVGMYGVGRMPIIDANGAVTGCIYATGRDYIDISDFELIGATGFPAAGVHMLNTSNVTIRRCWSHGNEYGVRLDNASSSPVTNLTVTSCLIEDSDQSGIIVVCGTSAGGSITGVNITNNSVLRSGTVVRNNGIHISTRLASTAAYDATRSVANAVVDGNLVDGTTSYGIMLRYVVGGSVSGNEVTHAGSALDTDTHGVWLGGCRRMMVENNEVHHNYLWENSSSGSGIGIYVDQGATSGTSGHDSNNVIVRNNHIHDQSMLANTGTHAAAAIYVYRGNNIQIYGNLIERCRNGIALRGATTMNTSNVDVHNNTLISIAEIGVPVGNYAANVTQRNNIVVNTPVSFWAESGAAATANVTRGSNCAYNSRMPWADGTLAAMTVAAAGAGDTTDNPHVTPTGRPSAQTPYGVAIGLEHDMDGNAKTNPPKLGAFALIQ